jgi:hypothetical protein
MSLNVSDALNATSPQGFARSSATAGPAAKRSSTQPQEGSDAIAKPKSLPQEPLDPVMRPHATVSTDDSLRRLPEAVESGRNRNRMRKTATDDGNAKDGQGAGMFSKVRSPYDAPPTRQRNLDLLA